MSKKHAANTFALVPPHFYPRIFCRGCGRELFDEGTRERGYGEKCWDEYHGDELVVLTLKITPEGIVVSASTQEEPTYD